MPGHLTVGEGGTVRLLNETPLHSTPSLVFVPYMCIDSPRWDETKQKFEMDAQARIKAVELNAEVWRICTYCIEDVPSRRYALAS